MASLFAIVTGKFWNFIWEKKNKSLQNFRTFTTFNFSYSDTGYYCGISLFVSLFSGLLAFAGIGSLARDSGSTITELSKISGNNL